MKKCISLILTLSMVISVFSCTFAEGADDTAKEIYAQSFEGLSLGELPEGWKYFGNKEVVECSYNLEIYTDGKASAFVSDKVDNDTGGYTSKFIEIEGGKPYSATCDIYLYEGIASMFLKFYDEGKKQLLSKTVNTSAQDMWTSLVVNNTAPENAKYVNVILGGTKSGTTVAAYDNFKIYSGIVKSKAIKPEKPFDAPVQKDAVSSNLVIPEGDKLTYNAYNSEGDKLPDFSHAGFYGGEYKLPDTSKLPLAATISPSFDNSDDTERIQQVIDKVYNEASDDFMKVIKLKAGKYNINSKGIRLKSGIVLSGEGQGPTGTVLYATDKTQYSVVVAKGIEPKRTGENAYIIDEYVNSGRKVITIETEQAKNFKPGDLIAVYHPSTEAWIKAIGMDNIKDAYNNNKNSWRENGVDMYTERTIREINGNKITLDFPLYVPLVKKYSQSYIYKITDELRLKHSGIENLRIESYYDGNFDDEKHASSGIEFLNAKDCFVRNVSVKHMVYSAIQCGKYTKQITISGCSNLEPVSQIAGGNRYSFAVKSPSQQILVNNCYSYDARHDYATSLQATGPVVFLDSINDESNDSSEPHGTWSTGILYDNIYGVGSGNDGIIAMSNRGYYGTSVSQGWTVAGGVVWNALQTLVIGHKPPCTYQNFIIGAWGIYDDEASLKMKNDNLKRVMSYYRTSDIGANDDVSSYASTADNTFMAGDCYMESPVAPVEPRSIYKAQLAERITGSYKNVKPNAPVIVTPRSDSTVKDTNVKFEGLYQKGAQKVIIYIDDKPYDGVLNTNNNTFTLSLELEKGVHKIYATQVINGVEGVKCADRFLTVAEASKNSANLSSNDDLSKSDMLLKDKRYTFDVYQNEASKAYKNEIKVIVNDEPLYSDVSPFETGGRVLVPMRAIFEALDASVSWDEPTATATATNGDITVKITENQTTAYVNNNPVVLDVPAVIENGRFVVPVRFISESFGAKVGWNDLRKTVTIKGGKALYPPLLNVEKALNIYDIKEPSDKTVGDPIGNSVDGIYSSSWGISFDSKNPLWASGVFDLGVSKDINSIVISFYNGFSRIYSFELYVSDDGENFKKVSDKFSSSGKTDELEAFTVNAKGRYLKYVSLGNNENNWSNIKELVITGK